MKQIKIDTAKINQKFFAKVGDVVTVIKEEWFSTTRRNVDARSSYKGLRHGDKKFGWTMPYQSNGNQSASSVRGIVGKVVGVERYKWVEEHPYYPEVHEHQEYIYTITLD